MSVSAQARISSDEDRVGQQASVRWVARQLALERFWITAESEGACAGPSPIPPRVTGVFCCRWTNVPFLLPTTMSGRPSPLTSVATTWVPTPESLSI